MELVEIKKHPPWKQAIDKILEKFEREGYGCLITDDEFYEYLSLDIKEIKTAEDYKKFSLLTLQRYTAIERLLCDHDIYLQRSPGNNGFEILSPKDQITKGYDKRMERFRKELNKLTKVVTNVNYEFLSMDEERDRQLKIIKSSMVKTALNKRKFELPLEEKKMIEDSKAMGLKG